MKNCGASSSGTNWKNSLYAPDSSSSITPQSRPLIGVARNPSVASPSPARTNSSTERSTPSMQIVPRMRSPRVSR
ncbi:MAG: hypothetical protein ACTHU0_27625 [Kofleriaceae bacterium]